MGLKKVEGEECIGAKISKDQITVFKCSISNGMEK
jgi:hypothetical protein